MYSPDKMELSVTVVTVDLVLRMPKKYCKISDAKSPVI